MSEMIERVARAIFAAGFHPDDAADAHLMEGLWEDFKEDRRACRKKARAAIEAMREPTDEMEIKGNRLRFGVDGFTDTSDIWRGLIDKALGDDA